MKIEFNFRRRWREGYCILLGWIKDFGCLPGYGLTAIIHEDLRFDFFGLTFRFHLKPRPMESGKVFYEKWKQAVKESEEAIAIPLAPIRKFSADQGPNFASAVRKTYEEKK